MLGGERLYRSCTGERSRMWSREHASGESRSIRPPFQAGPFQADLFQDWRPGRVGGVARRLYTAQIAAGEVDAPQLRSRTRSRLARERDDAAVGRPGRRLVLVGLSDAALARAVGTNHADIELAVGL